MKITRYTLHGLAGAGTERIIFTITPPKNPTPTTELGGAHLTEADKIREFLHKLPWGTVKALIESHPFSQLVRKH